MKFIALLSAITLVEGFEFVSIGDWGDTGAKELNPIMAKDAPEFVIAIGDNFYNDGVKSTKDPQWKAKFEDTFTAPSLQVPWYVCAGNHDYYGGTAGINAEMAYSNISTRWTYPSLYHDRIVQTKDETNIMLVSIDTWRINGGDTFVKFDPVSNRSALRNASDVEFRYQSGEMEKGKRDTLLRMFKEEDPGDPIPDAVDTVQLQWLDDKLSAAKGKADWYVVYGHFPVFSITKGEHGDTPSLVKNLYPILKKHNVDMYFNGHDHILQHIQKEKGGVHFFGSGAGARKHTGVNQNYDGVKGYSEGHYGYMVHQGNKTALKTSFRIDTGATPYQFTIVKGSGERL